MSLDVYEQRFRNLRVNHQRGHVSPHKPCMLLAVLQLAEAGGLDRNEIRFTPALLEPYNEIFEIVRTPNDHPNPYFPFFHLQGDGFWRLQPKPGREAVAEAMTTARSWSDIEENYDHAYLDSALFELIKNSQALARLREILIASWFPDSRGRLEKFFADQAPSIEYERRLHGQIAGKSMEGDPLKYDVPIRDRAFRRAVLESYDYRCAASGWRIILPDNTALVEAAHLIPFSEIQDDDPRNGIALAPSYHWALDKHLIAPGPDYKWHVSNFLDPRLPDYRPLLEINGKRILLPRDKRFWPKEKLFTVAR